MPIQTDTAGRKQLEEYFQQYDIPTESQFAELIHGMLNKKDDGIDRPLHQPLCIKAVGTNDPAERKQVLAFYEDFSEEKAAWTFGLSTGRNPGATAPAFSGLTLTDSQNKIRLFLDEEIPKIGMHTARPLASLHIKGDLYLEGNPDSSGHTETYFRYPGQRMVMGSDAGIDHTNTLEIRPGGSASGILGASLILSEASAPGQHEERVRLSTHADSYINSDGNFGLGTNSPQAKLHIASGALMPSAGNSETAGILFPKDPGGGGSDRAWIRYWPESGEDTIFEIGTSNDPNDHLRIKASGNINLMPSYGKVGIKTESPRFDLEVNGNAMAKKLYVDELHVKFPTSYTSRYGLMAANGFYQIMMGQVLTYKSKLIYNGAIWSSDIQLKQDIQPISNALENICQLQGVHFQWNNKALEHFSKDIPSQISLGPEASEVENQQFLKLQKDRLISELNIPQIGLIAQDVEKVAPELVSRDEFGYRQLDYGKCTALLVEGLKDLKKQVDVLKDRIENPDPNL